MGRYEDVKRSAGALEAFRTQICRMIQGVAPLNPLNGPSNNQNNGGINGTLNNIGGTLNNGGDGMTMMINETSFMDAVSAINPGPMPHLNDLNEVDHNRDDLSASLGTILQNHDQTTDNFGNLNNLEGNDTFENKLNGGGGLEEDGGSLFVNDLHEDQGGVETLHLTPYKHDPITHQNNTQNDNNDNNQSLNKSQSNNNDGNNQSKNNSRNMGDVSIDAPTLYKRIRARLTPSEFDKFATCIAQFNSGLKSANETVGVVKGLVSDKGLVGQMEVLIMRAVSEEGSFDQSRHK